MEKNECNVPWSLRIRAFLVVRNPSVQCVDFEILLDQEKVFRIWKNVNCSEPNIARDFSRPFASEIILHSAMLSGCNALLNFSFFFVRIGKIFSLQIRTMRSGDFLQKKWSIEFRGLFEDTALFQWTSDTKWYKTSREFYYAHGEISRKWCHNISIKIWTRNPETDTRLLTTFLWRCDYFRLLNSAIFPAFGQQCSYKNSIRVKNRWIQVLIFAISGTVFIPKMEKFMWEKIHWISIGVILNRE